MIYILLKILNNTIAWLLKWSMKRLNKVLTKVKTSTKDVYCHSHQETIYFTLDSQKAKGLST